LIILLAAGGYFYYTSQNPNSVPITINESTSPQIKKVIDEEVFSPIGAYDNNSIWYFNLEGHLFKVKPDGTDLSEFAIPSLPGKYLKRALWPKNGSEDFIVVTGDDQTLLNYFDSKAKVFINLPKNIQYLDWMPDGKRVVYIWKATNGKTQQLILSNADGTGYKKIADVFWSDLALKAGTDGKTVLMYRMNVVGETNKIYAANLETGEIMTLVDEGNNISAMWLPFGNKFLFGTSNNKVYLYDVLNKKITDLKLTTSLDKIVVDSTAKNLYAAVATSTTGDKFVKLDLASLAVSDYFEPSSKLDVKNVMLVGNTVYYVDSVDNKLNMIAK
jgi:WD40 repeat protein